jgi:hypothetical protein
MTESIITLDDIRNYLSLKQYLETTNPVTYKNCGSTIVGENTITNADSFLQKQIKKNEANLAKLNSSYVLKSNFLSLYNDQYNRNVEIFIGILFVSGVLAKIMFYPI